MVEGHLSRDELTQLSAGELRDHELLDALQHVSECSHCSGELDFMADLVAEVHRAAEVSAPRALWSWWPAGLAAALIVTAALWSVRGPADPAAGWSNLSVPTYFPTSLRSGANDRQARFTAAMKPYESGDHAAVIASLNAFLVDEPEHATARFYRGIAWREQGHLERAEEDLRWVVDHASGSLQDDSRWQLGQVLMRQGRPAAARAQLEILAAGSSAFARRAQRLLRPGS